MNLRFATDEIREYSQGNYHVTNTGKAFEEKNRLLADELLHAKAWVGGEMVNVFEPAVAGEPVKFTESGLAKLKKDELYNLGVELDAGVTEDNNKSEIIEKILATQEEEA